MGGDSIVPVIAGAYAFGARAFDARAALAASVKGATSTQPPPAQGWYYERWELHDEYLRRGYVVNTHTTSVSPVPNGASETLEYALDDFSISRLAQALGDRRTAAEFMRRSANWATLFNDATGWIAGRDADGAFMQAPLTENGQSGFQEGNAAQYTWMVPQDLPDLIAAMGGPRAAAAKLDAFFAQLDAGPDKPYAWLGNEPSLGSPWVYLSLGEPWKAQDVVRRSLLTLYGDTPWGLPGNDDLGTMSAWYLWCAIGLYPQNPAARYLDVGAPLFPSVTLRAPGGPTIEIQAPQAGSDDPYVQRVAVNGHASNDSWVALPNRGTLRLDFTLGTAANTRWASAPGSAPPAYASSRLELPASTAAMLTGPAGNVELRAGSSAAFELQLSNRTGAPAASLAWHATPPSGLRLDSERGTTELEPGASRALALRVLADSQVRGGYYVVRFDATAANGARLEHLDVPVRVTRAGALPAIAYATNRFGSSVSPIDLTTGATAAEIAVGEDARAAVLSADAARLYVADAGDNAVSVVDTSAGRSIAKVKVGNDPFALALEPGGKTLWVANGDDGTIQAIDTATLQTSPPLRVGSAPRGMAIAPDGSRLYTANSRGNSITAVDLHTRKVLGEFRVGARPWALAIAPDGTRLYVAETASSEVTPVRPHGRAPRVTSDSRRRLSRRHCDLTRWTARLRRQSRQLDDHADRSAAGNRARADRRRRRARGHRVYARRRHGDRGDVARQYCGLRRRPQRTRAALDLAGQRPVRDRRALTPPRASALRRPSRRVAGLRRHRGTSPVRPARTASRPRTRRNRRTARWPRRSASRRRAF